MRRGIFFGLNAVDQEAEDYQGWPGLLTGCVPDARDSAIASSNMGFETGAKLSGWNVAGKQIPWVMSGQTTREAWVEAHREMQAVAKPRDIFAIGFSGHGGRYDTPWQFDAGETLCFYDGQMTDREQYKLMRGWPAGVTVLYVIDSCHSGGMDKHIMGAEKFYPNRLILEAVETKGDIAAAIVQLCACRKEETASDGPQNGAFTGSLLAVWDQSRDKGERLSIQDWFNETARLMAGAFPNQHPIIHTLGTGRDALDLVL